MKEYICSYCHKKFFRYIDKKRHPKRIYCSLDCKHVHQKTILKGKNNPNFGNKWSNARKNKQSTLVKTRMADPEIRYKVGSANRGKKFSKDLIQRMHGHRKPESYSRVPSKKTRKLIGKKSKEKFTPEYREKTRKTMEDRGYWVKQSDKSIKQIYYRKSNWIERMFDKITDPAQIKLLKKHRTFNAFTNPYGVVRDHIYCRRDGLKRRIFPEILRHPCNCQLLLHRDNIKKKNKRYIDKSCISLKQLFLNIKSYKGIWKEHDIVLKRIREYNQGKRWESPFISKEN